jgi:hypothetical protein
VACPVFSLRTRDSVGVGEFLDINRLVDVCCMAGGRLYTPCRPLKRLCTVCHDAGIVAHPSDAKRLYAGMRSIQLLPVNDTSVNMMWWDSYPYSSLSVRSSTSDVARMTLPASQASLFIPHETSTFVELQVHALHPIYMSLRALTDNMPADLQVPAMQHDLSITSPSIRCISAVGCQGTELQTLWHPGCRSKYSLQRTSWRRQMWIMRAPWRPS